MHAKAKTPEYWLGIDVGGTKMLAEVYDADWNVLGAKKRKTKPEEGQAAGLERLVNTGMDALVDAGIPLDQLGGVGMGCPGALDLNRGVLSYTANLGWRDVNLVDLLGKAFKVPVALANDVDAGTYGEAVHGAGKGCHSVLGVFPGTGIGGGFVYDHEILRGKSHSCLEIGHVTAVPDGPRCGCGRFGCLEAVAGRLAIAEAAATAAIRGQAPWLRENAGTDPAKYRSKILAESVEQGDEAVREILEHACDLLGRVLGDTVNLLSPEMVVLGGGLVEAMPRVMVPRIRKAMRTRIMDGFADSYGVRAAKLGDHAATLGAAALARRLVESGGARS